MRLVPWLKTALIPWAAALLASLIFGLLKYTGGDPIIQRGYFLAVAFALQLILPASLTYSATLPLSISFGSTRKEALIGLLVSRIASAVLCAATAVILDLLSGSAALLPAAKLLPLALGAYLLAGTFSGLLGKACLRWGNGIGYGLLSAASMVVVIVVMTVVIGRADPSGLLGSFTVSYAVLAAGIVSVLLMLPFDKMTVYNYTVKV